MARESIRIDQLIHNLHCYDQVDLLIDAKKLKQTRFFDFNTKVGMSPLGTIEHQRKTALRKRENQKPMCCYTTTARRRTLSAVVESFLSSDF